MYPLPKKPGSHTANNENVTQSVITDLTGSSVQSGNLVVDEMSYEETYYSFDITSFLQTNLGTTGYDRQKLQLFLPDNLFYTTLQGVIFGDGEHTANKKEYQTYHTLQNLSTMKKILFCLLAFYTPCLYSYCTKYNELPYFHVRTGRTFYRGRRAICRTGGTGIALRGNNFLNNANPASLTES